MNATSGLRAYKALLRRRLPYVLAIAPTIVLGAVFLAFVLTPRYQATATMMLQGSAVAKDVIGSTVVTYAGQQIEIVYGKVMRIESLKDLVSKYDPYPDEPNLSVEQKAQKLLQNTSIERVDPVTFAPTAEDSDSFSLRYDNTDRERAKAVADRLSQLFLTYQQQSRVQAARDTAAFLEQQAQSISEQIREVDEEVAKLKSAQGDALPEQRDQNQAALERTQRNVDTLQQEILSAEDKESQLSVQLSQVSPNLITQTGDLTDLATVRAKLAEAEQRYTPDHPEVKRLRQALKALMAQQAQNGNPAPGGIVAGANNPQYNLIATQLASARRELASLRVQKAREDEKMRNYEAMLRRTPGVERTYSDIMRRRQSLQTEYQQIQDKKQNAQVAQSFETEQRGERLVMLRPPTVPGSPVFPNRIGFISLGILLGLGLTVVAIAIAESADPSVRNLSDLPTSDAIPLLGTIPTIRNPMDLARRRRSALAVGAAYGVALLAVGTVIINALRH